MIQWLEWSLVEPEGLGSIPALSKCFFPPQKNGGREKAESSHI